MERNDYSSGHSRSPPRESLLQRSFLADLKSCFLAREKENPLGSPDKQEEDRGSLESEKPSHRFGTPLSVTEKINRLSPKRTTCDKNHELTESPAYGWMDQSSAKRVSRFGQISVSIFQDSNEKQAQFRDFQPPSDSKASGPRIEKEEFIFPDLGHSEFTQRLFVSGFEPPAPAEQLPTEAAPYPFGSVNVFHAMLRESRGRAEPGKCNCRNSQCLKMYCDCLKRGEFCVGCNCVGCENNAQSVVREKKVGVLFEKTKKAAGGLQVSSAQDLKMKVMRNGCNCRKNSCLKKYCECHQFGLKCGPACRCTTCKNGREELGPTESG